MLWPIRLSRQPGYDAGNVLANLAQMIAVSGERIVANFAYALSQQNNHGISEVMVCG